MKIGIDLGGTNYRVGLLDEQNNIVNLIQRKNDTLDVNAIIQSIITDISDLDLTNVRGIGFCAPGTVDSKNKIIDGASNLDMGNGIEIGKIFNEIFKLPIYVDNDANCAGLAEAILGAGKGYKYVYYITHSTGIGASFIIDGNIIAGNNNSLGEIGSCLLNMEPKLRLENTTAGPAIAQKGKELLNTDTTRDVFDLAKQGDEKALNIIDDTFKNLAFTIANISYIVTPDCFVLGGGISNNFDFYYPVLAKWYKYFAKDSFNSIPIKKASLNEPGVIGASLLIK